MSKFKVFGHKPKWVHFFYNVFGSKLQKQYDAIKEWNDPELNKFLEQLSIRFPKLASKAMEFILALYAKYGVEKAKSIFNKIKGDLD